MRNQNTAALDNLIADYKNQYYSLQYIMSIFNEISLISQFPCCFCLQPTHYSIPLLPSASAHGNEELNKDALNDLNVE
jgi:hypothetical protein